MLVFVSASGFSPDKIIFWPIREVLLTGITAGKEKMKDQKAVLLLVQRCHCWFKTILFLLPLVQNDSLLYYLLPGTGRLFALS